MLILNLTLKHGLYFGYLLAKLYEFKPAHGFWKYYRRKAQEAGIRFNVEILMSHKVGGLVVLVEVVEVVEEASVE